MLQHGSYTLLIDACYDREIFPTLEQAIEWTWASTLDEIDAVKFVLSKFFVLVGDQYIQNRIQEEIDDYHDKSETNKRIAIDRETKRKEKHTNRVHVVNESPPNQEPITNNHKPLTNKIKSTVSPSGETVEVFDYWKSSMNHPAAQLDAKRTKAIKGRLSDGYTVAQLCSAVDGCKYDPFSQGANDRKTIYDDIELICRDGPKVDKFIGIASRGPQRQSILGEAGQATASAAEEWIRSRNAGRN